MCKAFMVNALSVHFSGGGPQPRPGLLFATPLQFSLAPPDKKTLPKQCIQLCTIWGVTEEPCRYAHIQPLGTMKTNIFFCLFMYSPFCWAVWQLTCLSNKTSKTKHHKNSSHFCGDLSCCCSVQVEKCFPLQTIIHGVKQFAPTFVHNS